MPKKRDKKENSNTKEKLSNPDLDRLILENFITLQKVLTNLSVKFEKLSDDISKMLNLFEISAKSFIEKNSGNSEGAITNEEKEFLNKLDKVLEQNKVIAKGLTLMEERIREKSHLPSSSNINNNQIQNMQQKSTSIQNNSKNSNFETSILNKGEEKRKTLPRF